MRYIIYECCYFFGGNVRKCVRSSREFTILPEIVTGWSAGWTVGGGVFQASTTVPG